MRLVKILTEQLSIISANSANYLIVFLSNYERFLSCIKLSKLINKALHFGFSINLVSQSLKLISHAGIPVSCTNKHNFK